GEGICAQTPTSTPTPFLTLTPTGTPPTSTSTPTLSCCGAPLAISTFTCTGGTYYYQYYVTNPCGVPVGARILPQLQNARNGDPISNWGTFYSDPPYTRTLQPGNNVITGTFVLPTGTPETNAAFLRTSLQVTSVDACWEVEFISRIILRCVWSPTPTWTRTATGTPTYTYTPTYTPTATP